MKPRDKKVVSGQMRTRRLECAVVALIGIASVWAVFSVCQEALRGPRPVAPATLATSAPALLTANALNDLLALEPSRLDGRDIALLNLLCAEGLSHGEEMDVHNALALLDRWAGRVKSETQRHFYRFQKNPAEYEHSESCFRMLMMAVVLHEDFQVRYNRERVSPADPQVFGNRGFLSENGPWADDTVS